MKKREIVGKIFGVALVFVMIGAVLGGLPALVSKVEASPATIYVPDNYPTIQAAVDAASPGDTIIVRDGTYTENVDVNKDHLTIQSQSGAETTIVQAANPGDHVFEVTGDYVAIKGLSIYGATIPGYAGIRLSSINSCTLENNRCGWDSDHKNHIGVYSDQSSDNTLSANTANSNGSSGISLYYSSNNTLSANTCNDNSVGIRLKSSSNNALSDNTCTDNWHGIYVEGSSNNAILGNIANDNNDYGICVSSSSGNTLKDNSANSNDYGIYLWSSSNNTLTNNTMTGNKYNFGVDSADQYLSDFLNNINGSNKVDGKPIYYLINEEDREILNDAGYVAIINSTNITAKDLTLRNNVQGVLLVHSTNSTIENVNASNNRYGIYLTNSSHNSIADNIVESCVEGGIILDYSPTPGPCLPPVGHNDPDDQWGDETLAYDENRDTFASVRVGSTASSWLELIAPPGKASQGVRFWVNRGFLSVDIYYAGGWHGLASWNWPYGSAPANQWVELDYPEETVEKARIRFNLGMMGGYWAYLHEFQFKTTLGISSSNNEITRNTVSNNARGIRLYRSSDNRIYLNNFVNNTDNGYSSDSTNFLNSPEETTYTYKGNTYTNYLGNYWSDYGTYFPPVGHNDPDDQWGDETLAYDENRDTFASVRVGSTASSWLELIAPPGKASQGVRFWVNRGFLSVDIYYAGGWHGLASWNWPYGSAPANQWVELDYPEETVEKARIRFNLGMMGGYWAYLHEFQFKTALDKSVLDANGDGIGDTPYSIDGDSDNYPLMEPFENYGIAPCGIGEWKFAIPLPEGRRYHASIERCGYVYVIGGLGGNPENVWYAPLHENGEVGVWTSTTSLLDTRASATSITYDDHLYIIGGWEPYGPTYEDVWHAPINSNGTLGSWNSITPLPVATAGHTSVVYDGYLYVIGGYYRRQYASNTYYNYVWYAPINSDGILGSWVQTTSLPTNKCFHTSVTYNGYLYVIGGYDGSDITDEVWYAPINSDGTIGSWKSTSSLPVKKAHHTSVLHNGCIYVIGGGNDIGTVWYAPIGPDGTIGNWKQTSSLFKGRASHTSVFCNGYVYAIGGYNYQVNFYYNEVEYAPFGSSPADTTPPAAVTDLDISQTTTNSVTLTWTAPGDDGNAGTATTYDLRYSTSPMNEANWDSATQVNGEPAPKPAGNTETFTVTGLSPATTYYFALKMADEVPNWSGFSNVAMAATVPGVEFSAQPTAGYAPLAVQFTDVSTALFTSWEWDFNSDGVVDSTEQNPIHEYGSGTYTVSLTAHGPDGSDTRIKTDYIVAESPTSSQEPSATFVYSPSGPGAGEQVMLDASASSDPDGEIRYYEWDLDGDGNYDGVTTSSKIYYSWTASGTYHVSLRVCADSGAKTTHAEDIQVADRSLWEKVKSLFSSSVKNLSKDDWDRFEFIKSELHISNWPHSNEPWSDPDFYWIDDNKLLTVLKEEIDPALSPLTYETYIFDQLHDMKLADSVARPVFTVDPVISAYFDNMVQINGWVEGTSMVAKEALTGLIELKGGSGIGIGAVLMLWDLGQAGVGLKLLDETFYKRALWFYFDNRDSMSPQEAFDSSPISLKYRNQTTRDYFEKLWTEYGGSHIGSAGGLKDDFKEQVVEQLRNLLLAGLEEHKFAPYQIYRAKSPGELRVYDSSGRVTGLVNGEVREEIPNSAYDEETETVLIYPAGDVYYCQFVGTGEGTYGLTLMDIQEGEATTFDATQVATANGTIHEYTVDWEALSEGEEGVTVQIDSDGDGEFEDTFTCDEELTQDEFMLRTATTIDFDPDTLNLKSKEKFVTVYIELPPGYDVSQIDVSSIRLNGAVPALDKPTELDDYDSDGIPDLMVKFDKAAVGGILTTGEQVEITVTGEVAGIGFEGSDTIRVIDG